MVCAVVLGHRIEVVWSWYFYVFKVLSRTLCGPKFMSFVCKADKVPCEVAIDLWTLFLVS